MPAYMPPIDLLASCCVSPDSLKGEGVVCVDAEALRLLIKAALSAVPIDPDLYLAQNDDLRGLGGPEALRLHFINHGYFEGRPFPVAGFDAEYYVSVNVDVARAFLAGAIGTPLEHYLSNGIRELRSPSLEAESEVSQWAAVAHRHAR